MNLEDYQPYGIKMFAHQRETMIFILRHKRCFVFDGLGCGKTLAALAAYDILMMHDKISKVLIVSPLSVMGTTWRQHILHFFPGRHFTVLHGTKQQRLANLNLNVAFYLINVDGIKILEDQLIKKKFDAIIIDESTSYASHSSARTKCAWKLCKEIPSVVAMTANPIPNDTLQSYAQAKLVHFDRPKWFTKYRDQLKIKLDLYNYIDRDNAVELAYNVLQPAIRHRTEDVIDLPPITYEDREISITKEQQKMYKLMEDEYMAFIEDKTVTAANAAVRYLKLLQISTGIIIDNEGKATEVKAKARVDELKLIYGQVDQLIVFASFTAVIDNIMKHFPDAERIDGGVSAKDRNRIITNFQNLKLKMIVANPRALSHGVNLQNAQYIVWFGPVFSAESYIQANGRIRRSGQTKPQFIIRFMSTKAEKKVYKALESKTKISEMLLNFGED